MTETPTSAAPAGRIAPRILVVEDDADQRELICEVLQMHFADRPGTRIVGVATAAQCLAQRLDDFDVVTLDYNLPDSTGLRLLEKITAASDVPVLFVTGENVTDVAAQAVRGGAQDYVVKLGDYLFTLPTMIEKNIRLHHIKRENVRLQRQLTASLEEIRVKNLQLEQSLRQLRNMAETDHLTGLANRRAFAETLQRCYSQAVRYGFDLSCGMCDLDHYKRLNDSLGHQVGDRILVAAAEVIRSNLRTSDVAARYGGDEFVLLLPHTPLEMARSVGGRIRRQLASSTRHYARTGPGVTLSMGVASLRTDHPASADALVAMADKALYAAKDAGKDRIVAFGDLQTTTATEAQRTQRQIA